jgi:capsular polysaccharide biosynthesis protein
MGANSSPSSRRLEILSKRLPAPANRLHRSLREKRIREETVDKVKEEGFDGKVFGIGLSRTATTSLAAALEELAITSPFQRETLEAMGIDWDRVVETTSNYQVNCEELVAPSLPRGNGQIPEWSTNFLRSTFGPEGPSETSQRIYVSREDAQRRRVKNENEVACLLRRQDYEILRPSQHSVAEQARKMTSAAHVIAPHGGGLANVVYCQPDSSVLEIFPSSNLNTCFWKISDLVDVEYKYITCCDQQYISHNVYSFVIPIKNIKSAIK